MPHSSTPIALIGSGFGLGLLIQEYFQLNLSYIFLIGFGVLLFVCHVKRWHFPFFISIFCCALILGNKRLNPVKLSPASKETTHVLVITKAANTNTFVHQYIAVTTNKELVLLQTNLSQHFLIGDSLLVRNKLMPIQSSKIHLGDMIDNIKPEIIIADGSNYPSFVARWKTTSEAKNTAFHSTSTDGNYPLN